MTMKQKLGHDLRRSPGSHFSSRISQKIGTQYSRSPFGPDGLPLDAAPLTFHFFQGQRWSERGFLRKVFWVLRREILSVRTQISMNTSLWWRFSVVRDKTNDPLHKREYGSSVEVWDNKHNTDNRLRHDNFTWKLKSEKTTWRRKIHYQSPVCWNYKYVLESPWVRIGWKGKSPVRIFWKERESSFPLEEKVYLH